MAIDANSLLLGIELKAWFGLSVVGTLVSTIGAILGIFLKDFIFSRSSERYKQRIALEALVKRYHDPLLLAASDLTSRLVEILDHYPTVYLKESVFCSQPDRQIRNSIHDPYFQKYKLLSTLYRFGSLLGWLELYRQELTFLHPADYSKSQRLELVVHCIKSDLADGQLNQAQDWDTWRDTLIFREELRGVGESMIEMRGNLRAVMGYGRFCELISSPESNATSRWSKVLLNFLLDLQTEQKDFRQIRLERLLHHLVELLGLLDQNAVEPYMRDAIGRHNSWCKIAI